MQSCSSCGESFTTQKLRLHQKSCNNESDSIVSTFSDLLAPFRGLLVLWLKFISLFLPKDLTLPSLVSLPFGIIAVGIIHYGIYCYLIGPCGLFDKLLYAIQVAYSLL